MSAVESLTAGLIPHVGHHFSDRNPSRLTQVNHVVSWALLPNLLKRALENKPPCIVKSHPLAWAIDFGHTRLIQTIISQPELGYVRSDESDKVSDA